MVTKRGQEHGIGIWDVDGHEAIGQAIRQTVDQFDHPTELDAVYVFGSFGNGDGVHGKSDLDVLVSVVFGGVLNESELSMLQSDLADAIEETGIGSSYSAFTSLDVQIADPARTQDVLDMYTAFEPVETYYDLLTCQKRQY